MIARCGLRCGDLGPNRATGISGAKLYIAVDSSRISGPSFEPPCRHPARRPIAAFRSGAGLRITQASGANAPSRWLWRRHGAKDLRQIRSQRIKLTIFEEFCNDLDTRAKYKEMGLSTDEKYELIELVRVFKKIVIDLPQQSGRVAGMDMYRKFVAAKLQVSGWLD